MQIYAKSQIVNTNKINKSSLLNDPLSINSNIGSIESSLKSTKSQIGKIVRKQTLLNTKDSKSHLNQQQKHNKKNQIIQWQAVYIEGKFYLTDKQTVQRYYQIQSLLQKERKSKIQAITKNTSNKNINNLEVERIQNLQTIKMIDLPQNEIQKQEDQSLLNNFNISTSECFSRFTLQESMQLQKQSKIKQNILQTDDNHISKNDKQLGLQNKSYRSCEKIQTNLLYQQKSQQIKNQYSYYLGANNSKIYMKKDFSQNIKQIKFYKRQKISVSQNHESNRFKKISIRKNSEIQNQVLHKEERKSHPLLSNKKISSLQVQRNKNSSFNIPLKQRKMPKTFQMQKNSQSKNKAPRKKKYQLPQINLNDKSYSSTHKRSYSICSKGNNHLNNFIKNSTESHLQILQMTKNRSKTIRVLNSQNNFLNNSPLIQSKNDNINTEALRKPSSIISDNELKIESNRKLKKDPQLNPEISHLGLKKYDFLENLSNLEKQQLQSQIKEIKKSLRQIEIQKLNKISKTIDLTQNYNNQQNQVSQNTKARFNEIFNSIPQQLVKIKKSSDLVNFKVPKQLLKPTQDYRIQANMSPQQLQKVAIKVYQLFGIQYDPEYRPSSLLSVSQKPELSFKKKQKLVIKKFKNCVFFDLIGSKTILWTFQNLKQQNYHQNFYIGGWSQVIILSDDSPRVKTSFIEKGKKNGYGLQINQKYIYEGQYLNGKKHGFGKFQAIHSHYCYEGQFIENFQSGHGKQYHPLKRQVYIGQFSKGKRHGKGYLKKLDRKQNYQKTSLNKFKFPYYFKGNYLNGVKQNGRQCFESGDQYKGQYLNQMFHGKGIFKCLNGSQYEGQYFENLRHGFGKWQSSPDLDTGKKNIYIGSFRNNLKDGEGKYIYKNGAYYQGLFENDLKHGQGALFYQGKNGEQKVLRGIWKQGNITANEKGQIFVMRLEKQSVKQESS